jgi:hypothetical protein
MTGQTMSRTTKSGTSARPPARSTWWSSPSPGACNTRRRCSAPPSGPRCPISRPPLRRRTATRPPLEPRSPHLRPAVRACCPISAPRSCPSRRKVFGESYPYGNKIECLAALPEGEPFVFFDSDTLILGDLTEVPFDFDRPSASRRVEGTWPQGSSFTDRATRRSGNRSTTGSASISKARSTSASRTNTGAATSISTPGSSTTAARTSSGPAS